VTEKKRALPFCEGAPEARVKPKNRSQHAAFTVSRHKLQPPIRKPVEPPPDPFALGHFGPWTILRLSDQTGKRGWARCGHCAAIHEISLVGDTLPSCGCAGSWRPYVESARRLDFTAAAFITGLRKRARS
jgi:hypothetical protein